MSQVLCVNRFNGHYYFLDKDGKEVEGNYSTYPIEAPDADVLMERIRQGYANIPSTHYVARLELTGLSEDDYFEFTDLITYDIDDDGYPVPVTRNLISGERWNEIVSTQQGTSVGPTIKAAVLDFEASSIKYVGNIFDADPLVTNPLNASTVHWSDEDRVDILSHSLDIVMTTQPVHVVPMAIYLA